MTGNGTERNPYIADASQWDLVGSEGSAIVTVTGSGVPASPYIISITASDTSATRTIFTASGTWVNPGGGSVAHVACIGGGGGGEGGNAGPGGGGGAMSTGWFLLEDLPTTVNVIVGAGGAGGGPTFGTPEFYGKVGGDSAFGDFLLAQGGMGTDPSQTNFVRPRSSGGQAGTAPEGGLGGNGGTSSGQAAPINNAMAAGGGGRGAADTVYLEGPGASPEISEWLVGKGGDGGGADFPGSAGALYGGGGGGGGTWGGSPSRWGGNGAPGIVVVTTW